MRYGAEVGESAYYPQGGLNSPTETHEKCDSLNSALHIPVQLPPMDPDLQRLLAAWPTLPESIRVGILAMIATSKL
jgi:hypothetical protein